MNLIRLPWLDYNVTYIAFVLLWSLSKAGLLLYVPILLFGFYVYLGSSTWLFETKKFKTLMELQLSHFIKVTNCKNQGSALLSYYSLWWTIIYLPAIILSSDLSHVWLWVMESSRS